MGRKIILHYRVDKNREEVFEFLTNVQKFVSVHPLIHRMDPTGGDRYLVFEKLDLGLFSLSFRYPVKIEKNEPAHTITFRSRLMKFVAIDMIFSLSSDQKGTLVEEMVSTNLPLPLHFIFHRVVRKQHGILFQNMSR